MAVTSKCRPRGRGPSVTLPPCAQSRLHLAPSVHPSSWPCGHRQRTQPPLSWADWLCRLCLLSRPPCPPLSAPVRPCPPCWPWAQLGMETERQTGTASPLPGPSSTLSDAGILEGRSLQGLWVVTVTAKWQEGFWRATCVSSKAGGHRLPAPHQSSAPFLQAPGGTGPLPEAALSPPSSLPPRQGPGAHCRPIAQTARLQRPFPTRPPPMRTQSTHPPSHLPCPAPAPTGPHPSHQLAPQCPQRCSGSPVPSAISVGSCQQVGSS